MICFLGPISSLSHSRRWLELERRGCERKLERYLSGPPVSWRGAGSLYARGINHRCLTLLGKQVTGKDWAMTSASKKRGHEVLPWRICSSGPSAQRRNSQEGSPAQPICSNVLKPWDSKLETGEGNDPSQRTKQRRVELRPQVQYNFISPSRAIAAM